MRSTLKACLVAATLIGLALPVAAGTINGTVTYEGAVPKLRPIKMDADPGCAKMHKTLPENEMLVLGEGQTMGNIFVQVKGVPAKNHPVPSTPAVLDQVGCQYVPHVLGVMKGQKVKVLNSDGLLHNVHSLPKVNKEFNIAMPGSRKEIEVVFDQVEPMFKIKCDVHPWMATYVTVLDHPYFDVTAKDGKFSIKNVPAGTYEVEIWHEKLKTKSSKVTVGDGDATVDFSFSAPSR